MIHPADKHIELYETIFKGLWKLKLNHSIEYSIYVDTISFITY